MKVNVSAELEVPELDAIVARQQGLAESQRILASNQQTIIGNQAKLEQRIAALEAAKPPVPPITPPVEPPVEPPLPPIVVTDPLIPVPPPTALNTKNFSGDDLGARLKAADERLGDREGAIILEPGTIAAQVLLRPKRTLYLKSGLYPMVHPSDGSRIDEANLIIGDHIKDIRGRHRAGRFILCRARI